MKKEEVLNCVFSKWYPSFKDVTIKSHIIQLPPEFLDYLHTDGVVLPEGTISQAEAGDEDKDEWNADDTQIAEAPSFPKFESMVSKSIKALGGKVFPKLNWSAPRDATWISFDNTLKCTCPSDVYLLLKSSDFISHDLTQPFDACDDPTSSDVQYELVLRKWTDINPGMEFRCFVKNKKVIDVFDVYRRDQGKLVLIDFNPFGVVTDGLLFTWDEMNSDDFLQSEKSPEQDPVFRYIESSSGVRPSPYQNSAVPVDFVDLASGEDPHKLVDFLQMKIQTQGIESSSDEEDATKPADVPESKEIKNTDFVNTCRVDDLETREHQGARPKDYAGARPKERVCDSKQQTGDNELTPGNKDSEEARLDFVVKHFKENG